MEEDKAQTQPAAAKESKRKPKRLRWLRRLIWLILFVLVVLVVIAFQPNLIRSPLQKWLTAKNIPVTIANIESTINLDRIEFRSTLSYNDATTASLSNANITVNSDWQRLFASTAKADIAVDNAKITLKESSQSSSNTAQIISQLFNFKANQAAIDELIKQIETSPLKQLGTWSVNAAQINYQGQTFTANLVGQGDRKAELQVAQVLSEGEKTFANLQVDLTSKLIQVYANDIELQDYADVSAELSAQLKNADLTLDLSDILASRLHANLDYSDTSTALSVLPAEDSSGFVIELNNQQIFSTPIKLDVQAEDSTLAVLFNELPLSVADQLKRFIPAEAPYQSVGGVASGSVLFDFAKNSFVNSSIKLTDLALNSDYLNFADIDAAVTIDAEKVSADLILEQSKLQLPALFSAEKKTISGGGRVDYIFAEQKIAFSGVEVHSADFANASAEGFVQIGDKVKLDIRGSGNDIDLSKTRDYLPLPIMTEDLIDWLSAAFVKGKANNLTFEIGSDDAENMFYDDSLKLNIHTEVADTDFLFIEDNPIINVKSGTVDFQGKGLVVKSDDATVGGVPIKSTASFADLTEPVLELKVVSAPVKIEQLLSVAEQSLVKEAVEETKAQLILAGNASLDLALTYDFINELDAFELGVIASKSDIALVAYPMLDINEAEVDVRINNAGLQSVNANAKFNNFQASIDIINEGGNINGKLHSIQPVDELFQKLTFINKEMRQYILQEKVIAGMTDLYVDFSLNSANELTSIDIRSGLQGADLNLFSAVVKPKNEKLPLDFSYDLNQQQIRLSLGDEFNLLANMQKQALLVSNDPITATKLPSNYLEMDVDFKSLDLAKMIGFYQVFGDEELQSAEALASTDYKKFSGSINLNVDEVNYQDIQIPEFKFSGVLNENFRLTSTLFDVSAQKLANEMLVTVEFIDIGQVTKLLKTAEVAPKEYSGRQVKISESTLHKNLPPLTINVKNIIMNGQTVATATLKSSKQDGRYSIDELYINGTAFIFELSAYEATDMDNLVTKSQATFRSDEVGKVLLAFGYEDVINTDSLDLQFNLTWPGGIQRLDLENSYGNASLNSENLQITNINTGVGNLLGLIDIVSIIKTIMMDVGQLVSADLSFSQVNGYWNIGGGRAQTKEFHANGTVVRLVATGGLDIHRKEYDFVKLLIIPKASNTLPIIGAVAGGIVGGIAALAIQQTFGDNIDRVVGIPYTLSGTWLDPKLTLGYEKKRNQAKGPRDVFNERNFGDK